jgi:hypothetical protein
MIAFSQRLHYLPGGLYQILWLKQAFTTSQTFLEMTEPYVLHAMCV